MGDRANVAIYDKDWPEDRAPHEAVFLYTHWGGEELPETLRAALERGRSRWMDTGYLARMITEEMVNDDRMGLTGMGIYTRLTDNDGYDLLVLSIGFRANVPNPRIFVMPVHAYNETGFVDMYRFPNISFEDYLAIEERTWDNVPSGSSWKVMNDEAK